APLRRPERTCSRQLQLKMKRVLTAAVLIPVVLLILFKAPWPFFVLVIAAIIFLTLREYLNVTEAYGIKPLRWMTYLVSMLVVVAFTLSNFPWLAPWFLKGVLS